MTTAQILVNAVGLATIVWIVWYFWLHKEDGLRVATVGGVQELRVTVKGGYTPDTIVVKAGIPVRLIFNRQESSLCSETVVFDGLDRAENLPEGEDVTVEFTPEEPGEIPFHCQMGMLRGKVVVTDSGGAA